MSSLPRADRLLLGTLLPVFAVVFVLHVYTVATSGLAQLPIYAAPAPERGGHPLVGGFRVETDSSGSGLAPGDRLLRVGDSDLAGAGFLGFDALALEAAGADLRTTLRFERDGVVRESELVARPHPWAWFRIPTLVVVVGVCTLVLLRGHGSPGSRLFFAACLTYAIVQAQFYGGPAWKTWVSLLLWNLGGPLAAFLMIRWATQFPDQMPVRARAFGGWAWVAGLGYLAVRAQYVFGGPLPPAFSPRVSFLANAALMTGTIALLVHNYQRSDGAGRRRIKWLVYGAMAAIPAALLQIAGAVNPELPYFEQGFAVTTLATVVTPICVLIAIARYNAFDIDRLISATASYSLSVAVAGLGLLVGMPAAGRWAARAFGMPVWFAQMALSVAILAVAIPLSRRLQPRLERIFFPERHALERGVAELLAELAACRAPVPLLALLERRVDVLLRPVHRQLHVRRDPGGELAMTVWPPIPWKPDGPLAAELERRAGPRRAEQLRMALGSQLAHDERELLDGLGDGIVTPLRGSGEIEAVLLLGSKRSGDVYTFRDVSYLAAIAQKASDELRRMRDDRALRRERERRREVEALRETALRAGATRTRLLAAASHDLRQPLQALGLFAEALGRRLSDPAERVLIERIEQSAESLRSMFDALLDLSQLEAGGVAARPLDFALGPLLERIATEAAPSAVARGVALRCAPTRLRVHSDPLLLARIVRNLVTNAIRYTDRGRVLLGARRAGDGVRIEVWDTGRGIPADRRSEVFQEFTRLAPRADVEGLGLGLAIVKGLAETLGHPIGLRSELGRGSCFHVTVTRARHAPEAAPEERTATGLDLDGLRVVVVDDDRAVREGLVATLESWGCRTLAADCIEKAVAVATSIPGGPDVVVCDLHLGDGEEGPGVIAAIEQATGVRPPALVVSADTGAEHRARLRAAGLPLLTKPVSPARLRAALWMLVR